jgi:hypothetical protein
MVPAGLRRLVPIARQPAAVSLSALLPAPPAQAAVATLIAVVEAAAVREACTSPAAAAAQATSLATGALVAVMSFLALAVAAAVAAVAMGQRHSLVRQAAAGSTALEGVAVPQRQPQVGLVKELYLALIQLTY